MLMIAALSNQSVLSGTTKSGQIQETSDEALVGAIAEDDRLAMRTLYVRHNVRVYRFVRRLVKDTALAEDIVSDVFLEVWRQADAFKSKSRALTWLLGIARNKHFQRCGGARTCSSTIAWWSGLRIRRRTRRRCSSMERATRPFGNASRSCRHSIKK